MNSSIHSLEMVFRNDRTLHIQNFRNFVWDEPLWKRFLEDMLLASKNEQPYFMGTLIFKNNSIIDGHQRLVCFSLFLRAWCVVNEDSSQLKIVIDINGNPKIRYQDEDQVYFSSILKKTQVSENNIFHSAYTYFASRPETLKEISMDKLLEWVVFVGIELSYLDNEERIHKTVNSLGVKELS